MLALLVLIALGALALGAAAIAFGGHRRFDEVDRFHRASAMTTAWARDAVTKPVLGPPEQSPSAEPPAQRQRPAQQRQRSDA